MINFSNMGNNTLLSYIIDKYTPIELRGGISEVLSHTWTTPDKIKLSKELIGEDYSDTEYLTFFMRYISILVSED